MLSCPGSWYSHTTTELPHPLPWLYLQPLLPWTQLECDVAATTRLGPTQPPGVTNVDLVISGAEGAGLTLPILV